MILPDVDLQSRDLGKCQEHARCCTPASMSVQSFCLHPALCSGSASSGLRMSLDGRTHISVEAKGHIVPLHQHHVICDILASLSH